MSHGSILTLTANETLSHTAFTAIDWDVETLIDGSSWYSAGNKSRLTVPASANGLYGEIMFSAELFGVGNARVELRKNGSATLTQWRERNTSNQHNMGIRTGIIQFTAGDYYEIFARIDTQAGGYTQANIAQFAAISYERQGYVYATPNSGFTFNGNSGQLSWLAHEDALNTQNANTFGFNAPPGCKAAIVCANSWRGPSPGGTAWWLCYKNGTNFGNKYYNWNAGEQCAGPGLLAIIPCAPGDFIAPVYTGNANNHDEIHVSIEWVRAGITQPGTITGSGALAMASAILAGSGTVVGNVSGSGGLTMPKGALSGSGSITSSVTGSGALAMGAAALSGAGQVGNFISGSGGLIMPKGALSGSGTVAIQGSGALTMPAAALSGSGTIDGTPSSVVSAFFPSSMAFTSGTSAFSSISEEISPPPSPGLLSAVTAAGLTGDPFNGLNLSTYSAGLSGVTFDGLDGTGNHFIAIYRQIPRTFTNGMLLTKDGSNYIGAATDGSATSADQGLTRGEIEINGTQFSGTVTRNDVWDNAFAMGGSPETNGYFAIEDVGPSGTGYLMSYTGSFNPNVWLMAGAKFTDWSQRAAIKTWLEDNLGTYATDSIWRLRVTLNDGDASGRFSLSELAFLQGGTDITDPTHALANSFCRSNFSGALSYEAFDGNSANFYTSLGNCAVGEGEWLMYDFGSTVTPDQVRITSTSGSGTFAPKDFVIEKSANGRDWTPVRSIAGETGWGSLESRTFELANESRVGSHSLFMPVTVPTGFAQVGSHSLFLPTRVPTGFAQVGSHSLFLIVREP